MTLAIIGGSGLDRFAGLEIVHRAAVRTPYGEPSGPVSIGRLAGRPVLFLARHGDGHTIAPHDVNYRANLWALKEQQAEWIVSVASVGGIRSELVPGSIVLPHQIIDYTWGRRSTFFEGDTPVKHIDFTEPYSRDLRLRLLAAAEVCGEQVHDGGVYAATQGPRLETAAEISRLERDGADIVGMTAMPEAALARELELQYAAITVVVNHAAGRSDSLWRVDAHRMEAVLVEAMARVRRIIETLAGSR